MTIKNIILSILTSLLYFVLGFIIIFSSSKILNNLWLVISIITITLGILGIYSFFSNKEYKTKKYFNLTSGIINIWISLFTLNYYNLFIDMIPIAISVYSVAFAVIYTIEYYQSKQKCYKIIAAILNIITIILTLNFFALVTTKVSGLFLIMVSFYIITKTVLAFEQKPKIQKTKSKKK